MSPHPTLTASYLLSRPGRHERQASDERHWIARCLDLLPALVTRKNLPKTLGGIAVVCVSAWFMQPIGNTHALANLLGDQGYWEIAAPADFYLPGTINTIEVRSDGKIELHPTCTIDPELLAKVTIRSRTIDRDLARRLDRKFDVSAQLQDLVSAGIGGNKGAKLNMSFRNSGILTVTDEDLWRLQREVVKEACREAIEWNINNGGRVCQTRSALRGDLVYDVLYGEGISVEQKGKLTAELAATLKVSADEQRTDRMLGNGLIYGVKLLPAGITLDTPDAKLVDCRVGRT
jgi:hypothetical protein